MNRRTLAFCITAALIVAAIVLAIRYSHTGVTSSATQSPIVGSAHVGGTAPEFTAATNHGYFDLAKTARPVFLEVFATWCPHCQRETVVIDRLYARYKDRMDFVGVSGSATGMDAQSPSSEQDVMNFVDATHAQYPVAYDGSLAVAHAYLQGGFPTLVVIDSRKVVRYLSSGEVPYGELSAAIQKVI